jgi:hypothetical protein
MKVPTYVLLLLVLEFGICSCGQQSHIPSSSIDYTKFVSIAGINGDPKLVKHVEGVLHAVGITAIIEGSVVYGISVPPDRRPEAIEVLRKDAAQHKYWIEFSPTAVRGD